MIPNPDQLQTITKMREGDLAEIPFAVLLHAMAAAEMSVVLEIERKPLKKEIVIENGLPVDCRSNLLHETLPRFMVTQGRISEEQSQEYLNKSASQGLQFQEALILDGVISASDLFKVLQSNLARKLLDGFTWRSGNFRVLHRLPKVESPLKVKAPQLVLTGISKFAGDGEVNGAVGPLVGKRLFLHPDPVYDLDDIRLGKAQEQVISLLESGKRIDELAAESTVPFDKIMRLVYALAIMGIVVPEDRMPQGAEPGKRVKKEKKKDPLKDTMSAKLAQSAPMPTMQLADLEKLSNRVMATYLRYRSQDSFELLGIDEEAGLVEVQDAYLSHCRKFAPWQFEAPGLQILVDKARDLFIAGGQAFGELCDVEKRNALIQRRQSQREEAARKPDADRFAIKSDLLDSEHQFKRGKALMQKGNYAEARKLLEFAFDCDPQNSVYGAEVAYCKFLDKPHQAKASADALRETLRIDPKSGLATYYLGMVLMHLEEYEESEKLLQRAIKMLSPDRRPIEGLKDLQVRAKQKKKKLGFLGG